MFPRHLLAAAVLCAASPLHAQSTSSQPEPLADDVGNEGMRPIITGTIQAACGLGLGTAACLVPVCGMGLSALWNSHQFSAPGTEVRLPAPGPLAAPRFTVMGLHFEGLFAVAALTGIPTLAAAAVGTLLLVVGTSSAARGVGRLVDAWVGREVPQSQWRTETRTASPFKRVRVEGGAFKVRVRHGDTTSIQVKAPAQYLDRVFTTVTDDTLVVSSAWRFRIRQHAEVEIVTPTLDHVELAGLGHVEVLEARGDSLRVVLGGAGKADVNAHVRSLAVEIMGAGASDVTGQVDELRATVTGTGAMNAVELVVRDAHVEVSGAGTASVAPTGVLDARISGVGKVRYRGEPAEVRKDVEGLGSVERE